MQTTKQPTGLGTAASVYVTLVQQAINKVTAIDELHKELDRAINVTGKTRSTLTNYSRHLAHLALHYNRLPTKLDQEQVLDYHHPVKPKSSSAFGFPFSLVAVRFRFDFCYSGFGPFEIIVLTRPGNQRCNQTKTLPWVVKT
jgi:hypothetical protein